MPPRRLPALALAVTLLAAGCGGSDDGSESSAAVESAEPAAETTTVTTQPATTAAETTTPETTEPPATDPPATDAPPATEPPDESETTEPTPEVDVPSVAEVDPDGQLSPAALDLLALFDGEEFADEAYDDDVTYGPLFVELTRVSAVPGVTAAAIEGITYSHCFSGTEDCTPLTQETVDVLVDHLTVDEEPPVVLNALDLADRILANRADDLDDQFEDEVFSAVVALGTASDDPRLDRSVIYALGSSGFGGTVELTDAPFRGSAELEELFRSSIASPDPGLAALALQSLIMGRPEDNPDEADEFFRLVVAELEDPDPGVRAAALQTLDSFAEYVDEDDPRWAELRTLGDTYRNDPHPLVRCFALDVLGALDDLSVIAALVADHLDDHEVCEIRYTFESYTGNELSTGYGYPSSTVSTSALDTIDELTARTDFPFDMSVYEFDSDSDAPPIGEQVAETAVPDAREWFAANEAAIAAAAGGD